MASAPSSGSSAAARPSSRPTAKSRSSPTSPRARQSSSAGSGSRRCQSRCQLRRARRATWSSSAWRCRAPRVSSDKTKQKPLLPRRSSCTTRLNRYSSKRPSLPPA
ncbi:hypothetical protein ACFPRL_23305 [Pseudoclavibacter helvolus]